MQILKNQKPELPGIFDDIWTNASDSPLITPRSCCESDLETPDMPPKVAKVANVANVETADLLPLPMKHVTLSIADLEQEQLLNMYDAELGLCRLSPPVDSEIVAEEQLTWVGQLMFCNCLCVAVVVLLFSKAQCVKRDCEEFIREQVPTLPPLATEPFAWPSPPRLSRATYRRVNREAKSKNVKLPQTKKFVNVVFKSERST